jgi:Fe-S-cluster containining protein
LDGLWEEVARRPLWAPQNILKTLSLGWNTRLRLLQPGALPIVAPPGKVNDCGSCTENCCVGPESTVVLTFLDIATLIDIGRTDLMTQDKPPLEADTPARARTLRSLHWQRFPVLKKKAGACAALSVEGRCTLHPHWPLSCARFPYALHADLQDIYYSPRCDAFWIRADGEPRAQQMATAAVLAYNQRIKDILMLAFAQERLTALGLMQYLQESSPRLRE